MIWVHPIKKVIRMHVSVNFNACTATPRYSQVLYRLEQQVDNGVGNRLNGTICDLFIRLAVDKGRSRFITARGDSCFLFFFRFLFLFFHSSFWRFAVCFGPYVVYEDINYWSLSIYWFIWKLLLGREENVYIFKFKGNCISILNFLYNCNQESKQFFK